jgi:hypothetical protein
MKITRPFLVVALAGLLASATAAQGVGSKMPEVELEGFSQTPAKSYEDFLGRTVLIEFFAYW